MLFCLEIQQLSYSLPKMWQIGVSIATIISSCAVFIYIIQIWITKKQFNRQIILQEEQFTLLNQGYIVFDLLPQFLTNKVPPGTPHTAGMTYSGVVFQSSVKNVGHTPLTFVLESFVILFNGAETFHHHNTGAVNPVYPDQAVNLSLGFSYFNIGQNDFELSQIKNLNISCRVIINYTDFNQKKIKKIERSFQVLVDDNSWGGNYTNIKDSI